MLENKRRKGFTAVGAVKDRAAEKLPFPGMAAKTLLSTSSPKCASLHAGRERHQGKAVQGRPEVSSLGSGVILDLQASRVGVPDTLAQRGFFGDGVRS